MIGAEWPVADGIIVSCDGRTGCGDIRHGLPIASAPAVARGLRAVARLVPVSGLSARAAWLVFSWTEGVKCGYARVG